MAHIRRPIVAGSAVLMVVCLVLVACTLPASVTVVPSPSPSQPAEAANVIISALPGAGPIPAGFAGFSIEPAYLCRFLQMEQQNPPLRQLYRNLAPTVVRLGGNSMDQSSWDPASPCNGLTFGDRTLEDVFSFARSTDAQVIWGVNLKANNPSLFAGEAADASAIGGGALLGLEIGNEPNNWASRDAYIGSWEAYANAIDSLTPGVALVGPSMTDYGGRNWFVQYVQREHARLSAVTYHYYALQRTDTSGNAAPTISRLLDPELVAREASDFHRIVGEASVYGLPLIVDEANSVNGGGDPGVSDTFAAALWATDFMFVAAEQGVRAVEFHGRGGVVSFDPYGPIAKDTTTGLPIAQPLYYAMLLFHEVTGGGEAIPLHAAVTSSANLTAHAIVEPDGALKLVLINKDQRYAAQTKVAVNSLAVPGVRYHTASVMRLIAPSAASTSGVTLGGSSVSADGSWSPKVVQRMSVNGTTFNILVPAASAVVVTLSA